MVLVLEATKACLLSLRNAIDRFTDQEIRDCIENYIDRLHVWAGSVGVFAHQKASIDWRLRSEPELTRVVLEMLSSIQETVSDLLACINKEAIFPTLTLSDDSSDSSSHSLVFRTEVPDTRQLKMFDRNVQPHELSIRMIDDTISRMYRLSRAIRTPVAFIEDAKIQNFREKDESEMDVTQERNIEFAFRVRFWLEERHLRGKNPPNKSLADRLVSSSLWRRRRLLYYRNHQQKPAQGSTSKRSVGDSDSEVLPTSCATGDLKPGLQLNQDTKKRDSATKSKILSSTEASRLDRGAIATSKRPFSVSTVSGTAYYRHEELDIPPVPRSEMCPYCFCPLDESYSSRNGWREHVLGDLEPYVCVFEDCLTADRLYNSLQDWVNHTIGTHCTAWSCKVQGHQNMIYQNREELENHLRDHHAGSMSNSQMKTALANNFKIASALLEVCPLCHEELKATESQGGTHDEPSEAQIRMEQAKRFKDHVALHLESLALLSLPEESFREGSSRQASNRAENDTVGRYGIFVLDQDEASGTVFICDVTFVDQEVPTLSSPVDWSEVFRDPRVGLQTYKGLSHDSFLEPFRSHTIQTTQTQVGEQNESLSEAQDRPLTAVQHEPVAESPLGILMEAQDENLIGKLDGFQVEASDEALDKSLARRSLERLPIRMCANGRFNGSLRHFFGSMDTGSDVNIIRSDVAERLFGTEMNLDQPVTVQKFAGGREIRTLGQIRLNFCLEDYNQWYSDRFYVLASSDVESTPDVWLGTEFVNRSGLLTFGRPTTVSQGSVHYETTQTTPGDKTDADISESLSNSDIESRAVEDKEEITTMEGSAALVDPATMLDEPPELNLSPTDSSPVVTTIEVFRNGIGQGREMLDAALEPTLLVNLVTHALVQRTGHLGRIYPNEPDVPAFEINVPHVNGLGLVDLTIRAQTYPAKSLSVSCLVVQHWSHDMVLGSDFCRKSAILPSQELKPSLIKRSESGHTDFQDMDTFDGLSNDKKG